MSASVHTPSTTTPKGAIPPVEIAGNGPLWRSILDTHSKEILQCASDQFLDLAAKLRLERINARDLVRLPAKAGELGSKGTNIVENNALDCLPHEANESTQASLATHSASKVPDAGTDHGSDSTASEPSPAEATRGPKRRKKDEGQSLIFNGVHRTTAHPTRPTPTTPEKQNGSPVRQRMGSVRIRDQAHINDMASGRPDRGPPTKVETMKRRRGVLPIATQSQGTMPEGMDFIVISDTERESSGGN